MFYTEQHSLETSLCFLVLHAPNHLILCLSNFPTSIWEPKWTCWQSGKHSINVASKNDMKNKKNIECIVSCLRKTLCALNYFLFLLHINSLCMYLTVCVSVSVNICTCCWVHTAVRGQPVEISSLFERNSRELNIVC